MSASAQIEEEPIDEDFLDRFHFAATNPVGRYLINRRRRREGKAPLRARGMRVS